MDLPEKIAFVDIETTGGNFGRDRIIEVGVVKVEKGVVRETWQSLVDPLQYLPPEIVSMTGILPAELEKAPTFRQIADDLETILEGCVFAAHNVRFDFGFIKSEFRRIGRKLSNRQLCTVKLSRRLYPAEVHHNLDAIISRFEIQVVNRHRALDDAMAAWEFFKKSKEDKGEDEFGKCIKEMLKRPSIPSRISEEDLDNLPELPGVYIFYGDSGMPLYVGKSINIRERVMSHLSSTLRDSKELRLAQEVAQIETEVCSGELGALLREADLVKQLQPLHNRRLRQSKQLVFVDGIDTENYKSVVVSSGEHPSSRSLGVFKSKKDAENYLRRKCEEHNLCAKLLGLEKVRDRCFASELDRCTACVGQENPLAYNLRFDMAFGKDKLVNWPFNGPIIISETGEDHMFDMWCYMGKVKEDAWMENTGRFDLDTYKILLRFFKVPQNLRKVKVISKGKKPGEINYDEQGNQEAFAVA